MREGSIVAVNYTGRVLSNGKVFDTTMEKKAIEAGIFDERAKYKPVTVIVGENELLKGLDGELKEMNVGEQKKIVLKPSEAFGERKAEFIKVLPLREFQRQKLTPIPGLIVDVNGMRGKVQSVSGGRVRVDFNHPLAGKELEFELKIEREISGVKEQVQALFEKYFGGVPEKERKLKVQGKTVEVFVDAKYSAPAALKKRFSDLVTKHVKGIETVRFVEEFSEQKKRREAESVRGENKKTGKKEG